MNEKNTVKRRIEPYQLSADYYLEFAHHKPLLAFMRRVTPLLAPGFFPPYVELSREEQPETTKEMGRTVVRRGDSKHGFEISHTVCSHPHWGYRVSDELVVRAYGLPINQSVSVTAFFGTAGKVLTFIELRVEGPEEAITAIVEAFEAEFRPDE